MSLDRVVPGAVFGVVSGDERSAMFIVVVHTVHWRSFVAAATYCFCRADGAPGARDPDSWRPLPDFRAELADGAALLFEALELQSFEYIDTLPAKAVQHLPNPVFEMRDGTLETFDFDTGRRDNIFERTVQVEHSGDRIWPYRELSGSLPELHVAGLCPCTAPALDAGQGSLF